MTGKNAPSVRRPLASSETHSIDFVPLDERYGSPWRLFTLWFSANFQIAALVVGCLGVAAGLSLAWSCVAIVIGVLLGTVFMAAHSAQGPHLGIPQMIQSRAQFGVFGAGLPLLVFVFANILFAAANAIMMRDAVQQLLPIGGTVAIVLFGAVTLVISYFGYELIHRVGFYLTIASGALFALTLVLVSSHPLPESMTALHVKSLKPAAFMLIVTQATSWALGYGPFVADYSRYLPATIRTSTTFWFTYCGNALGAGCIMVLGAVLASVFPGDLPDMALTIAKLFGSFGQIALIVIVLGVLQMNVLCAYSSFMSGVTIFTGFSGVKVLNRTARLCSILAVTTAATIAAVASQHRFNTFFSDTLIAQVYLIVPWSAVNLVDYYWIARGRYSVPDIYDADGIYGRVNWRTLGIYGIAIIAQIPFMDLSFYRGPIAQLIGADVAWIAALVIPTALYACFASGTRPLRIKASAK